MDDPKAPIFDISSDDEESNYGGGGAGEGGGDGGGGGGDIDDYQWISDLLHEESEYYSGGDTGDSDDVVVVSEVRSNQTSLTKTTKDDNMGSDGDDDDCVVLDGDPEKPLVIENEQKDDDSDELVVTGEKGEIACRDFPHSRHLCAKYPYASTPHETHCEQCHCFVCDLKAPCASWGNGLSSINHCHATDKEEYWKAERRNLRIEKAPVIVPETPLPIMPSVQTYTPPPPLPLVYQTQNQGLVPITQMVQSQNNVVRPGLYNLASAVPISGDVQRFNYGSGLNQTNFINLGARVNPNAFKRRGQNGPNIRGGFRTAYTSYGNTPATGVRWRPTLLSHQPVNPVNYVTTNPQMLSQQQQIISAYVNRVPQIPSQTQQQQINSGYSNIVPQIPSQSHQQYQMSNSAPLQNQNGSFINYINQQPSQPSQQTQTFNVLEAPQIRNVNQLSNNGFVPSQSIPYYGNTVNPLQGQYQTQETGVVSHQQPLDQSGSNTGTSVYDWVRNTNPITTQVTVAAEANSNNQSVATAEASNNSYNPANLFSTNSPEFGASEFKFDNWFLADENISDALETGVPPGFSDRSPDPGAASAGGGGGSFFFDN